MSVHMLGITIILFMTFRKKYGVAIFKVFILGPIFIRNYYIQESCLTDFFGFTLLVLK